MGRKLEGGGGSRRAGRAGDCSSGCVPGDLPGLEGSRGGRAGDLAPASSSLALFAASTSRLDGGSVGSFAWSSVGGSLLPPPWLSDAPFRDRVDIAEMCEASDELEPLRPGSVCADGRRDGSSGAGAICFCEFREGSGGAALREGAGGGAMPRLPLLTSSVCRRGRGGVAGAGPSVMALVGRGGTAGLFGAETLLTVESVTVRTGATGGGGGGARLPAVDGGALKFFCLLSAAIRSASVVNCGSSTSAILHGTGNRCQWLQNDATTLKTTGAIEHRQK